MNRQILSDVEDKDIAELYASAYKNLHAPQELYRKVMNMDQENKKVTKIGRGLPKVASVASILVCVLALSGGVVWAMTASPLKDFFFKNSGKEFSEIYKEEGTEFAFGEHKIVFEGSIYDDSVGMGLLNLSVWDREGNPCDLENEIVRSSEETLEGPEGDGLITRFITQDVINLGEDKCFILLMYLDGWTKYIDGNNIYISFDRMKKNGNDYFGGEDFRFVLLNNEDMDKARNEISKLDLETIKKSITDSGKITQIFSRNGSMQPEVADILENYTVITAEKIETAPQVIQVENLKITVGRIYIMLECNKNDCTVKDFVLERADGTNWDFKFTPESTAPCVWSVMIPISDRSITQGGQREDLESNFYTKYNFNFILGKNEKVKIKANGKIYE